MPCPPKPIYLVDSSGTPWLLAADNNGRITITATPGVTGHAYVLLNDLNPKPNAASCYALTVLPAGFLVATASPALGAAFLILQAPNANYWELTINQGLLTTAPMELPANYTVPDPVVGEIFNPDDGLYRPQFTQPGGIGQPTLPAQDPGQMLGLFVFGCGHWFNNMMVRSVTVGCQRAALLQCPVCDYIQRIITPYSDIYDFSNEILMA